MCARVVLCVCACVCEGLHLLREVPDIIHPASRGVAAHTAGFFWSVTGAEGGVEHEGQVCWHASQFL